MELTVSELRILIDALECKYKLLQQKHAALDEAVDDSVAEISNDLYVLELLMQTIRDEFERRIEHVEAVYQTPRPVFSNAAMPAGVFESSTSYHADSKPDEEPL